jgi:hypothetical protein
MPFHMLMTLLQKRCLFLLCLLLCAPCRQLLQLASAADAADSTAASDMASAALQQLLQPQLLLNATTSTAADFLIHLAGVLANRSDSQQQQQHGQQRSGQPAAAAAVDSAALLQQCLRCMLLLQRDPRGLQPSQLAPLLSALLQLQQLHQQQQQQQLDWQLGLDREPQSQQGLAAAAAAIPFAQLQQEALAAVGLQLEDSARYLTPFQLSECVKVLALLNSRPLLALAAVVTVASGRHERFSASQLVWMLWGLTKLRFTREAGFVRMLKAAVEKTVLVKRSASQPPAAATSTAQQQQQQQLLEQSGAVEGGSEDSRGVAKPPAAAAAAPLHQLVALLWVSTSRGYQSAELSLLLQQILQHNEAPSLSQASSVAWSYARMSSYGMQQQLQPQLVEWLEQNCSSSSSSSSSSADEVVPVQSVVNIAWALTKLGELRLWLYSAAK